MTLIGHLKSSCLPLELKLAIWPQQSSPPGHGSGQVRGIPVLLAIATDYRVPGLLTSWGSIHSVCKDTLAWFHLVSQVTISAIPSHVSSDYFFYLWTEMEALNNIDWCVVEQKFLGAYCILKMLALFCQEADITSCCGLVTSGLLSSRLLGRNG